MQSHDCGEGDWVDAQLVSRPPTTRGHAIQWQCFIWNHMGAEMWADYPPADNATTEHSFMWYHKKTNVELTQSGGQIAFISEAPGCRAVLQVVGRRVDVALLDEWDGSRPGTCIVAIGAPGGIDAADLRRRFEACVAA